MNITGTKKKILDISLELFAKYGYSSVSMEQISEAVGIKAPSLYKHFKGKKDIFNSIFALMDEKYKTQIAGMQMHMEDGKTDIEIFERISEQELLKKVMELVQFSLHDDYNCKFRKLLTTHQYTEASIGRLYTERYVEMLLKYHRELFQKLIDARILIPGDTEMMALQYVSPIYTLIGICDREPECEEKCMEILKRHIHQFNAVYRVCEN